MRTYLRNPLNLIPGQRVLELLSEIYMTVTTPVTLTFEQVTTNQIRTIFSSEVEDETVLERKWV